MIEKKAKTSNRIFYYDAIRAFAINSKDIVQTARDNHNTSPIATAALGRMLSAGAMMGAWFAMRRKKKA